MEALTGPPTGQGLVSAWAWEDEQRGIVRARVFPVALGIAEDEATGANAVIIASGLGRALDIRQGRASRITAMPLRDGRVELGGRVTAVEQRNLTDADDMSATAGSETVGPDTPNGGTDVART